MLKLYIAIRKDLAQSITLDFTVLGQRLDLQAAQLIEIRVLSRAQIVLILKMQE